MRGLTIMAALLTGCCSIAAEGFGEDGESPFGAGGPGPGPELADQTGADQGNGPDRMAELEDQVATLTRERDDALARAEKAEKSADRAKAKAAKATSAASPTEPRKLGPNARELEKVDEIARDALREAIGEADKVEIAFSDGERELPIPPVTVEGGDAWRAGESGLALRVPELLVHGAGPGQLGMSLAGYALLLDGKLTAYAPRAGGELHIGPGMTFDLKDDVVF